LSLEAINVCTRPVGAVVCLVFFWTRSCVIKQTPRVAIFYAHRRPNCGTAAEVSQSVTDLSGSSLLGLAYCICLAQSTVALGGVDHTVCLALTRGRCKRECRPLG
jgi:hypothetical protein